ncbi:MAG: diguanylate cyclase [Clostridia bacterium]|nr:diguanylate cyclase [Clostridia bacterium]
MGHKKLSFSARYVLAFGLFLLAANTLLGVVILRQSESAMRSLIDKNMLDIVNTAADLLDGDTLGALTEDDVGGEVFNDVAQKLTVFQKNADIQFIYAVKQIDEDTFVFTVDPDPVDPGAFGEEIVVTEGIKIAGKGTAAVDNEPMADRWGNFYSAYSPVFDSNGKVAGIVGIDFGADWYDEMLRNHTVTITVLTVLSISIGGLVIFFITNGVRKRFKQLNTGLAKLSSSVDQLVRQADTMSGGAMKEKTETAQDELEALGQRIQTMQKDMTVYLEFLQKQAYTDSLTKVGNSTAYHELVQKLEEAIQKDEAAFSVIVFDVNSLKMINDKFGHEWGDKIITGAAEAISRVFGAEHTFRIGGDEFSVVKERVDEREFYQVDLEIAAFNRQAHGKNAQLSVSKGLAHYEPGMDHSFKEVFARADMSMYEQKKTYYQTEGNRRAAE